MSETTETFGTDSGPEPLPEGAAFGRRVRLAPDHAALAQNGAAISIASCTESGAPIVGLGVGCRLAPEGTVRVFLSRAANAGLVDALRAGGPVAVTFTATRDHASFQVKAARADIGGACPDDLPEIDRQATLLREGLVELGFSPVQAAGYVAFDAATIISVSLSPERLFSQTPGPGAGSELPG